MCHQLLQDEHLLTPCLEFSPKTRSCLLLSDHEDSCVQEEYLRIIPDLDMETEIHHSDLLKIQNSVLHDGTFVLHYFDIYRLMFGKICDV